MDISGETVGDILERRAARHPERQALAFVPDLKTGEIRDRYTYAALHRSARRLARALAGRGCVPGDRVLMLFDAGLDFVTAFFACGYAGLVAVPAPPPDRTRAGAERVDAILADAEPALILTDDGALNDVREWLGRRTSETGPAACVGVSELAADAPPDEEWHRPRVTPDDLALLQYTSGSTTQAKGVMVTHGNLVANLDLIHRMLGRRNEPKGCGWLPLTHDMGLIGQLLYPLYAGGWCLMMPPMEFVKRPHGWLKIISDHRIEATVAPNFAYDMCVRRTTDEQAAALDLRCLRAALNGAEPIDPATLERFAAKFAPSGFRPEAMLPCYGLAEATLLVSGKPHGQAPTVTRVDREELARDRFVPSGGGRALAGSGAAPAGTVLIVDRETRTPVDDGRVGEIWVTGPCVARGYWERPDSTAESFQARLAGPAGDDGREFLRTGDLGVLADGQLYVTGRIKDVIICQGRNLYSRDLELTVQEQAGTLRFGGGAVVGLSGEDVVVLQEVQAARDKDAELSRTAAAIKHELARLYGAGPTSVVFLRPGAVRRTTSGKIRRAEMRRLFLAEALEPVHESLAPGLRDRLKEMA